MAICISGSRGLSHNLNDLRARHEVVVEVEPGNALLESAVFAVLSDRGYHFNTAAVRREVQAYAERRWLSGPVAIADAIERYSTVLLALRA